MTLRGTIRNGNVHLEGAADWPDGTSVEVHRTAKKKSSRKAAPSKSGKLDPVYRLHELAVETGIADLAAEHEHYAYGTPKKSARTPRRTTRKGRRK